MVSPKVKKSWDTEMHGEDTEIHKEKFKTSVYLRVFFVHLRVPKYNTKSLLLTGRGSMDCFSKR